MRIPDADDWAHERGCVQLVAPLERAVHHDVRGRVARLHGGVEHGFDRPVLEGDPERGVSGVGSDVEGTACSAGRGGGQREVRFD